MDIHLGFSATKGSITLNPNTLFIIDISITTD